MKNNQSKPVSGRQQETGNSLGKIYRSKTFRIIVGSLLLIAAVLLALSTVGDEARWIRL